MSTRTQVFLKTGLQIMEPASEPMFSEEFMSMIYDRTYETLRAYLEKTKQTGAVELLDDLIILAMRNTGDAEQHLKDRMMSEAVGAASYHVLSLGGKFE